MKFSIIKNAVKACAKKVFIFTSEHKPAILLGAGIAGSLASNVLTAKSTIKAVRIYDKECEKKGSSLTKTETIKACGKCYISPAITEAASILSSVASGCESSKRIGTLATALSMSEGAAEECMSQLKEILGEKELEKISSSESKSKVESNPIEDLSSVPQAKGGHTLCFEPLFSRYFYSDKDTIQRHINEMNRLMVRSHWISYDDFWTELGLEPTGYGPYIGYSYDADKDDDLLYFRPDYCGEYVSGEPCLVVKLSRQPKPYASSRKY